MNVVIEDERIPTNIEKYPYSRRPTFTQKSRFSATRDQISTRIDILKEDLRTTRNDQSKLFVWEQGAPAGTGNGRDAIGRECSGPGGSGNGYTERRTLDSWTTLPAVEYRKDSA